jgi:CRISPR-associated protein Csy3
MSKPNTVSTPSVLAFERKLDPSDALLYAGNWADRGNSQSWQPISITTKSVRGTISNRMKGSAPDPAKFDADIQNPNLQTVDVAALPANADTLKLSFTLRILGNCGVPSACNRLDYQAKLRAAVNSYRDTFGFTELAKRYAHNLANGRPLWRNRASAESVESTIRHLVKGEVNKSWTFDALALSVRDFNAESTDLAALAKVIESALSGDGYTLLEVNYFARVGASQEVFPSQELILDKKESKKSKTLYQVSSVAALHSQKIGNALRTIDTWYESDENVGPIAVEPYGSVTALGKAFRQPKQGFDFYSQLDEWMIKDKEPKNEGHKHYVIANLIRGGVYGKAEEA